MTYLIILSSVAILCFALGKFLNWLLNWKGWTLNSITNYRIAVQQDNKVINLVTILNTLRKVHNTRYIDTLIDYLNNIDSVSFQLRITNVSDIIKNYLIWKGYNMRKLIKLIVIAMFIIVVYDTLYNVYPISIHGRCRSMLNGDVIRK